MEIIQLDECIDSDRLVKSCEKDSPVKVYRLPKSLKTREAREEKKQKDRNLLPILFDKGNPILTIDLPIDEDNSAIIPDHHPGIIVVGNAAPIPPMTLTRAMEILGGFKQRLSNWHELSCENSIIKITQDGIRVYYVRSGSLFHYDYLSYASQDWQKTLIQQLSERSKFILSETASSPVATLSVERRYLPPTRLSDSSNPMLPP